jgi:protoheme IX farnesyltransferase
LPRIGVVIALTAVAGCGAAGRERRMAACGVVPRGAVSSAAAGAFNQYWEHDLDRRMRRTRTRPFVTGKLVRSPAWVLLIAALAAGATAAAWATTNGWAAVYTLGGAVGYAIVYTVGSSAARGGTSSWAASPAASRCSRAPQPSPPRRAPKHWRWP